MGPSSAPEKLPEWPPSPPRDIAQDVEDALDFLEDSNEVDRASKSNAPLQKQQEKQTPTRHASADPSHDSAPTTINTTKKVDFSPWTTVCRHNDRTGQHRTPTRRDTKPLKSILKISNLPPPLTPDEVEKGLNYFSPKEPGSFAKMLKSVLQQLGSPFTSARLDAYLALNGALKTYDNVPEPKVLEQNMEQIVQFMMRDIAWKDDNGKLDLNIVTQVLKLACALACDEKRSKGINDEFRTFLIDRAVASMEGTDLPKAVVKVHMFLIAQQRFPSSVWNSFRAERCIAALNTIDQKVSGNNVIATRLVIYQRLLSQARQTMLNHVRDWLDHIFHSMLSNVPDVRIRAIETGRKAALDLGTQIIASKSLSDMMGTQVEEGQSYCDYLSLRLQQMIEDKEVCIYVPQIWAVAILFFRNKKLPLEQWKGFKTWLLIIQKCLNKRDARLMRSSMLAWNKLVYVIQPDRTTSDAMSGLLGIPTATSLVKPNKDSKAKKLRPITLEGYYNLLHYALRPGLEFETLDKAWDTYVEPALFGLAKTGSAGRGSVCRILQGLFSPNDGVWNSDAALKDINSETAADGEATQNNALFKPEDLPMLPVKWTRTRLLKILTLVEPCLQASFWKPDDACADTDAAWHALMQSLSEAGRQEVKTSRELKEAIALLVKMYRNLWTSPRSKPAEADNGDFIRRLSGLFNVTVDALGPSVFTEDILARTKQDDVEAAPTPSHRQSKHHLSLQSPLVFVLGMLMNPTFEPCELYHEIVFDLLTKMSESRSSEAAKVELLRRSWQSVSKVYGDKISSAVLPATWRQVARCATQSLNARSDSSSVSHDLRSLKLEIDNLLAILTDGLKYTESDMASLDCFIALYTATATEVRSQAGNGALVYAVTEPFAKTFRTNGTTVVSTSTMQIAQSILETAPWVPTKQALEQGRRALLGVNLPPNKAPYNPFENVFAMITDLLVRIYNGSLEVRALDEVVAFVKKLQAFLQRAPDALFELTVRNIQGGVAVWLADVGLKTKPNHNYAGLSDAIAALYIEILEGLRHCSEAKSALAEAIEPLLGAGMSSPHRTVVSATIFYWNETFGVLEVVQYPPKLEAVLRAREIDAAISLPGLTSEPGHVAPASLPPFFESDNEELPALKPPKITAGPFKTTQSTYFTAARSSPSQNSAPSSVAQPVIRRQSLQSIGKTKLRHEDSQIDFASIGLPPPLLMEESQHLTEHQKEVTAKQRQEAQLFPNLSSSPVAHSTALPKQVPRRLDFSSSAADENDYGQQMRQRTPTGTPDTAPNMTGYLGSSPTPKASEKASAEMLEPGEELAENVEEALQDPPSSPPKEDEEMLDLPAAQEDIGGGDTTLDVTWELTADSTALQPEKLSVTREIDADTVQEDEHLASDCRLPDEQLHQEEAQGHREDAEELPPVEPKEVTEEPHLRLDNPPSDDFVDATEVMSGPPSREQSQEVRGEDGPQRSFAESTDEDDVSRVENSFIGQEDNVENASPASSSRRSRRTSAKRKREDESTTPRKRKGVSPYKKPFTYLSSFFRRSQEDNDDDIGDEIVVASSQPSESPVSKRTIASPVKEVGISGTVHEEPSPEAHSSQVEAVLPPKRGRGRPRKSETPTNQPSQSQSQSSTRKLKRTASALSNSTNHSFEECETSSVKDTPAPAARKVRKTREGTNSQIARESQEAEAPQEPSSRSGNRSSSRRLSPKVMVPARPSASSQNSQGDDGEEGEEASNQASPEQLASRAIASPKSILARLRGVLADCGKMILGSQEEREFDDALFELRREVHDAARRGREQ